MAGEGCIEVSGERPPAGLSLPRKSISSIWGVVALAVCVVALVAVGSDVKAKMQLLIFPLVVVVLWQVRLFQVRVPRVIFVVACLGALAGVVNRFSHVGLAPNAFTVAGGREWDLNQEVKIYRDRLRRALRHVDSSLVGLHGGAITSHSEAQGLLSRSPMLGGVVWGSSRWMNVSFQARAPLSLTQFPEGSVARGLLSRNKWADLQLLVGVSSIGLSGGEEDATVHYIARLIPLWRDFIRESGLSGQMEDFEAAARSVHAMQARWTSRAHVAFVLWLSGTHHLLRALASSSLEGAELSCAIEDLELAKTLFRSKDNPELGIAVRNNYAVALLLQSEVSSSRRELRRIALGELSYILRMTKKEKTLSVVRSNRAIVSPPKAREHGNKKRAQSISSSGARQH